MASNGLSATHSPQQAFTSQYTFPCKSVIIGLGTGLLGLVAVIWVLIVVIWKLKRKPSEGIKDTIGMPNNNFHAPTAQVTNQFGRTLHSAPTASTDTDEESEADGLSMHTQGLYGVDNSAFSPDENINIRELVCSSEVIELDQKNPIENETLASGAHTKCYSNEDDQHFGEDKDSPKTEGVDNKANADVGAGNVTNKNTFGTDCDDTSVLGAVEKCYNSMRTRTVRQTNSPL